jgi:serine/threonine protein kinase
MNRQLLAETALDASQIADEVIAEYLQAAEAGEAPNRSEFVRNHIEVRSVLESFFEVYDQLDNSTRPKDSSNSFAAGQQLGRYHLGRPIGAGTFGTVWLGFDSQLKRPVAIKVPNLERFSTAGQHELFLSEAQNVAQLDHPNIVPIYDVGETKSGEIYLVSRFVPGKDLATELKSRKFTFVETARCVANIASALEYAHGRKLIHRDVKPSNILIDAVTRQPYITDFGLAGSSEHATANLVVGTPAYMSPEQIAGNTLDHRSDIFSLGVVLFEMLCGRRPFVGENPTDVMNSICDDQPPLPAEINRRVPLAIQTVCLKALSKPIDDRYLNSTDLESDLRTFVQSQTASADKTTTPLKPFHGGRPWLAWTAGLLALTATLALTIPRLFDSSNGILPTPVSEVQNNSNDRHLAERTIEMGGYVDVKSGDNEHEVTAIEDLPEGDISLLWVMFNTSQAIEDDFFRQLQSLNSLRGIDLFTCKFSDAGFEMLGQINSLRCIHAPATQVADTSFSKLAQLPRLWRLNLTSTNIGKDAFKPFAGNTTLRILRIANTGITDDSMKDIGSFENLEELNVDNCNITDKGVQHLSSLRHLKIVRLGATRVTAKSLEYLTASPIKLLTISAPIPEAVEQKFLESHPNCRIIRE